MKFLRKLPRLPVGLIAAAAISCFPLIFFYANNTDWVKLSSIVPSVVTFLTIGGVLWLIFFLISGSACFAGVLAGVFNIPLIYYSSFENFVHRFFPNAMFYEIVPVMLFIFGAACFVVRFIKPEGEVIFKLTAVIAVISVGLSGFNLFGARDAIRAEFSDSESTDGSVVVASAEGSANFYYIIFDEYMSFEQAKVLGIDNSAFKNDLVSSGFTVSDNTFSTSIMTYRSIANTLNLLYVVSPEDTYISAATYRSSPDIMNIYNAYGYTTHAVEMGIVGLWQIGNCDKGIAKSDDPLLDFENVVEANSILSFFAERNDKQLYIADSFEYIKNVARSGEKGQFVFCHLMSPHTPFALTGDAFDEAPDDYLAGYEAEIKTLNGYITDCVNTIIANDPDCVILLQSDHGSRYGFEDLSLSPYAYYTFNAVYFRGSEYRRFDDLSVVNMTRAVCSDMLGMGLPDIEDVEYYAQDALNMGWDVETEEAD